MNIKSAVNNVIFPFSETCVLCSKQLSNGMRVCGECLRKMDGGESDISVSPPSPITAIIVARQYSGDGGKLIRMYKYAKIRTLSTVISNRIFRAARVSRFPAPDIIAYVPPHRQFAGNFIFDHARILAQEVAVQYGMSASKVIKRVRNGKRQATLLTSEERIKNVMGAFRADKSVVNSTVLLIDDVYTTGSTAYECAKALKAAGAERVYVAAFARGSTGHDNG